MMTSLTIARKAMKFGYKRYGVPGAIASGAIAVAGYLYLKKRLTATSRSGSDQ